MPQLLSLATFGTLTVAGALLGVQLGRGAVSEIDPHYFSPLPAARFYADLVPGGYDPAPVTLAANVNEVWLNNRNVNGRPECFDCANFIEQADVGGDYEVPLDVALPTPEPAPAPTENRDYMPREVERYASFPITREEAAKPRREYAAETADENKTDETADLLAM